MRNRTHRTQSGQVVAMAVLLVLVGTLATVTGLATPALREARGAENLTSSRQSFFVAESLTEDVIYRLKTGVPVDSAEALTINGDTASATIAEEFGGKIVRVVGDRRNLERAVTVKLVQGDGVAFNYGMQASYGGIRLENSASVLGNVYANGQVTGSNSNIIYGDVVSAGPTGLIDGIHATGTAYAHTVRNSDIGKDAYYQSISRTTVGGALHPGSADLATTSLPISDEMIAEWEAAAAAGGTISSPCPYKITSNVTLGPKKIACNLEITGNPTITLAGGLWVAGNVTITNQPTIRIDPSLTEKGTFIIADNPANRRTSGVITLANGSFFGAGDGSYILLISQNNSAETTGSGHAIEVNNSASGELILYAGHGEIDIQNTIDVREVTAWRIHAKNSAQVVYKSGLASSVFTIGPAGGFEIVWWDETE